MPEMAEVETVRNVLKKQILHKKIKDLKVLYPKMIQTNINDFKKNLINEEFIDIKRKGKYLLFETNNYFLISHLRMEGKYFIKNANEDIIKHEHVIFTFNDNTTLRYHDVRKFGVMFLVKKDELNKVKELNKLGYDVNDKNLTPSYLLDKLKNKKLPIKTVLLDQKIISGLGNIYADEVLFKSKINPLKKANEINEFEANAIISSSKEIIDKAISLGGTTIRSYTSSLGVKGNYQDYLQVHKREGENCNICGNKIIRIKVGTRSTYYCKVCQKI